MNASELTPGQPARITDIKNQGPYHKLFEMGCVPGTIIYLEFSSPLGDPMAFNIDGYVLGLRKNEAAIIEVEPIIS